MNHKPSVRSLFTNHRTASLGSSKRTSSISNAIRTASVGTAFVGNSRFHIVLKNTDAPPTPSNQNIRPSEVGVVARETVARETAREGAAREIGSVIRRSPFLARKSPLARKAVVKDNEEERGGPGASPVTKDSPESVNSPGVAREPSSETGDPVIARESSTTSSDYSYTGSPKSEDRLSMSELFAVYSRITRRKVSFTFIFVDHYHFHFHFLIITCYLFTNQWSQNVIWLFRKFRFLLLLSNFNNNLEIVRKHLKRLISAQKT